MNFELVPRLHRGDLGLNPGFEEFFAHMQELNPDSNFHFPPANKFNVFTGLGLKRYFVDGQSQFELV